MLVNKLNRTKNLKAKFLICLILSFVLFIVVYVSKLFETVINDVSSDPFSTVNILYLFSFIFLIVPFFLWVLWMMFPPIIEKILKSFDINIEETNEQKEVDQNQETTKESFMTKIVARPPLFWFICVLMFLLTGLLYEKYYLSLEITKLDRIVELLVQTDGVILGFSGVIIGLVLKEVMKKDVTSTTDCSESYNKIKLTIILHVFFTIFSLTISMFCGLSAIITQNYAILLILSFSLFFTGIIELFATLVYSIEYAPRIGN